MTRVSFQPTPTYRVPLTFLKPWVPSMTFWGIGAGTAALFLLSVTPLVKREFLTKVPVLGNYYEDHTPASDKPF